MSASKQRAHSVLSGFFKNLPGFIYTNFFYSRVGLLSTTVECHMFCNPTRTLKITEKKFLRENTISSNTAFNFNLITDSDSAEFSKDFDLFEFLCLFFLIEIFTARGTEHGKNHFFDLKLHLNLTS